MNRDDLIRIFCRGIPDRVAEGTELWLGYEQGKQESLPTLRRLLHTLKGEAHMLELAECGDLAELTEKVVDAVRASGDHTELTGDSVLGGLEAIAMATQVGGSEEAADFEGVKQNLRAAADELNRVEAAVSGHPVTSAPIKSIPPPVPVPESRPPERAGREVADARVLRVDDVRPVMHELRRLFSEQEYFHKHLRETQRMLRALLAEIDPNLTAEQLAERVTKTLGYGAEIDRKLGAVRADWSANEFSMGTALEDLEAQVERASVVSTERLLNQVLRVGRSTARTLDKEVEFKVRGEGVLDAAVEQRLEPSLIHLVRNAVDHGIESTSVRAARGKPARGRISVSLSQTESSVRVEVSDDGGGVDFNRLREKLGANGERLSQEELIERLFEHGVSTAQEVTTISGRGIGLDVVSREVGSAGGQVRIERTGPTGTTIALVLPSTLRGEIAVPMRSGRHRCAVASRSVHSVVRIESLERTDDGAWLRIRTDEASELVRVRSLGSVLGDGGEPQVGEAAVVLYHPAGLFAVSVESYDNPRSLNLQTADEMPFRSPLVRGVAPTPDGGVLLLLSEDAMFSFARSPEQTVTSVQVERRQPRALVVEDAPVARELLCGVLRSIGLVVDEATDGRQGLMKAQADPPDIVLTDIEMPHMNGIQMIAEFRRSPQLSRIPIIVLSTAAHGENRTRLAQLGVKGILSKQKFVERELCELIGQCINMKIQ